MHVYIDCDHHGTALKTAIVLHFSRHNIQLVDLNFGIDKPYPLIAKNMASKLYTNNNDKGILICNTGIGMSIVANKFPSIYANNCTSIKECSLFRKNNNGNLLCIGVQLVSEELAIKLCETFMFTLFDEKNKNRTELVDSIFVKEDRYGN